MSKTKSLEFLLYKLEQPFRRVEKRELKKDGEKEKYIQDLFSENLSNIFSNLIFLAKECGLESISGERGVHRLDTLAFDKDKKCFVIIEYKNKSASELASQIKTYLDCLDNIDNQYTLLRYLNNRLKKDFHRTEIEWDETKGICIATEIDGRATWVDKEKNIKILEIKFYDDILFVDTRELPKWLKINLFPKGDKKVNREQNFPPEKIKKGSKVIKISSNFSIDDILVKADWPSPKVKDWLNKIRKIFLTRKWLNEEVKSINVKEKQTYAVIYYWEKVLKSKLFSLLILKNQINIQGNWPSRDAEELAELLGKYGIKYARKGRIATGNWDFPAIKSDDDLQMLKNFFQEYKEKFSNSEK